MCRWSRLARYSGETTCNLVVETEMLEIAQTNETSHLDWHIKNAQRCLNLQPIYIKSERALKEIDGLYNSLRLFVHIGAKKFSLDGYWWDATQKGLM